MSLDGMKLPQLGSMQDKIRVSAWYRREQLRIFEALINVYASMITIKPDIVGQVEKAIDEYIELIVPGSKEFKDKQKNNFIQTQASALDSIYDKLKAHAGSRKE